MTVRQRRAHEATSDVTAEPQPRPPRLPAAGRQLRISSPSIRATFFLFLAAYITIFIALVFSPVAQRHLTYLNFISLNPVFPPKDPTKYGLNGRPVEVNHLNGWHIAPPHVPTTGFTESFSVPRQRIIIYLHGNAGTRAWPRRVEAVKILADSLHAHVLSFDYTGFGDSPGSPSESQLYADAESVYHWVRDNSMDADVWFYGQSLGTFAAVELGTRFCTGTSPRGILLEAPPASLVDAALTHPAAKAFRILPNMRRVFETVLTERLDSVGKIGKVCLPMLIMHGDRDEMIPLTQGQMLYSAARDGGVEVEFFLFEGYGHKNVNTAPEYVGIVKPFLERHSRKNNWHRDTGRSES